MQSAKQVAYEHVKAEMLAGRPGEGEFLTEEGVADALGMSRTPVREAFVRLEAERLLVLLPRKGALIRPTSYREMVEVMEVRQMIEVFAAGRLLELGVDAVPALTALIAEQGSLAKAGDAQAFIDCDRRFHIELVTAAGNSLLVDTYQSLRDRQLRMGLRAVAGDPVRMRAVLGEHEEIVAGLAATDAERAERALVTHLRTTLDVLRGGRDGR